MKSKEVHESILATERRFVAAYNQGDAPGLAASYTQDGQIMPPNAEVVAGPLALEALFRSFWDAGDTVIELETVEAEGSGDIAYEVGKYTLSGKSGQSERPRKIHRGLEKSGRAVEAVSRYLQQ